MSGGYNARTTDGVRSSHLPVACCSAWPPIIGKFWARLTLPTPNFVTRGQITRSGRSLVTAMQTPFI